MLVVKLHAQEIQVDSLKQVVVSANRTEQPVADVPRSVTVITAEEIAQGNYYNLSELLSTKAGLFAVGGDQAPGANQSLFLRGAASEHVLIMIDGVRITDPSSVGNVLNLNEISMNNIERIEIIRGANGMAYSNGAIGGVINIITKKGLRDGLEVGVQLNGGIFEDSDGEHGEQVNLRFGKNNWFVNAGGRFYQSLGMDATTDTISFDTVFRTNDRDAFQHREYFAKTGYTSDKFHLSLMYRGLDQQMDIDGGAFNDDENYTLDMMRHLITLNGKYMLNDRMNVVINGGWNSMVRNAINDSSVLDVDGNTDGSWFEGTYTGATLNADAMINYSSDLANITLGGGVYSESMSTQSYFYSNSIWGVFESETDLDSLELQQDIYSVFANADINGGIINEMFEKFGLTLGGRMNFSSIFGMQPVYNAGLYYKPNGASILYVNSTAGFTSPSLYRLYTPESNFTSGVTRGNEDLEPERSVSAEIGYRTFLNGNWLLDVSAYWSRVNNAIHYVYLWDGAIGLDTLGNDWMRDDYRGDTYVNLGSYTNTGVEIALRGELSPGLMLSAQVTMNNGEYLFDSGQSGISGNYHIQLYESGFFLDEELTISGLTRRSNTAFLGLTKSFGWGGSIGARARWVGPRYDIYYDGDLGPYGALNRQQIGDYTVIDLTAGFRRKGFIANLRVANLLNQEYFEISGFNSRGIGVYLRVGYVFGTSEE